MASSSRFALASAFAALGAALTVYIASRRPSVLGADGEPLASVAEVRELLKSVAMVAQQLLQGLAAQQQQLLRMGQMDPRDLRVAFLQEFVGQLAQIQAATLSKFPGVAGGLSGDEFDGLLKRYQGDPELRRYAGAIRDCYRKLGGQFTGLGVFAEDGSQGVVGRAPGAATRPPAATSSTGARSAPTPAPQQEELVDIDDIEDDASPAPANALTLDRCFEVFDVANERMLEVFRTIKRGAEARGLGMDSPEAMQQLMAAQAQSTTFVEEECRRRGLNMEVIQGFLQRPEHQMEMAQRLMASQEALQRVMIEEGLVPSQPGMGM